MSDDKTIIEKSMTQTDAAIASVIELAAICDTLIAEKEKLAAHNAMLRIALIDMRYGWRYIRRTAGDLYGVGWDRCEQSATTALNATQADVDAWEQAKRDAVRYRWWQKNIALVLEDEAGISGVAFSFQIPLSLITTATDGEMMDFVADAAIAAAGSK